MAIDQITEFESGKGFRIKTSGDIESINSIADELYSALKGFICAVSYKVIPFPDNDSLNVLARDSKYLEHLTMFDYDIPTSIIEFISGYISDFKSNEIFLRTEKLSLSDAVGKDKLGKGDSYSIITKDRGIFDICLGSISLNFLYQESESVKRKTLFHPPMPETNYLYFGITFSPPIENDTSAAVIAAWRDVTHNMFKEYILSFQSNNPFKGSEFDFSEENNSFHAHYSGRNSCSVYSNSASNGVKSFSDLKIKQKELF